MFDEGIKLLSDTDNRRLPVSLLGTEAEQRKSEKDKESVLIDKIRDASIEIANGQFDKVKFYFKNLMKWVDILLLKNLKIINHKLLP